MPNNGYFDSKRDTEIINAGGFFCHACLVGKQAAEQSLDPRYCRGCYDFLVREAEMLPENKRPVWIPKHQKIAPKKQYQIPRHGEGIMSTLERQKFEVDIIQPTVASRVSGKRGPKHRQLPEDLIRQLNDEGMGARAIASELKAHGIEISYKTVQRIVTGQRTVSFLGRSE